MNELKGCEKAVEDFVKKNSEIIKKSIENMDFDCLDRGSAFLDENYDNYYFPRELSVWEEYLREEYLIRKENVQQKT